jgi:hypothetical protein
MKYWSGVRQVEEEVTKHLLHQPDAQRKIAKNVTRHTNKLYAEHLYKSIESVDIIFLVGSAAVGKSMSARLCHSLRENGSATYFELQLNMVPANCGRTVANQIYDFLVEREEPEDCVLFLDEVGSAARSHTNQQFWRYLYQFFNTGRLSLTKERKEPVGIPGKITIIMAANVGQSVLNTSGMIQHYERNSAVWNRGRQEIHNELRDTIFRDGKEEHIVSRVLKPATIVYYFGYHESVQKSLTEHLIGNWITHKLPVDIKIEFALSFFTRLTQQWRKNDYDLRSFLAVYRKLLIDAVAETAVHAEGVKEVYAWMDKSGQLHTQ